MLWAFAGLARAPSRALSAVAVLSLAAAITSHNLMSFLVLEFTAAWVLWEVALVRQPANWADFGPVTRQTVVAFDLFGLRGVGTTNDGEFLPVTVHAKPQPHPAAIAAVQADQVEKVDRTVLPADAQVTLTWHDTLRDEFAISAGTAFTLKILTFYGPGWTAYLDGTRVPITVTEPDGPMAVAVPAGAHTLLAAYRWPAPAAPQPAPLPARPAAWFAAVAVGLVLLRIGWNAGLQWQAAHQVPTVAGAQVQRFTRFDNGLALVAYTFDQTEARPGEPFTLTFYWEVIAPMRQPASVFVHFYGPDGTLWGQADKPDPVEFFPTTRWALGQVTQDVETATLKPDAPPGVYTAAVGLWDRATGHRSLLVDEAGQPTTADKFTLTTTFIVQP